MIFATKRLKLRVWTLDDLPAAESIYSDAEVMRFIDEGDPETLDEIRRSLEAGIAHQARHGLQHWAVERDGTIIGACGFNLYEEGPDLELVFHFARSAWGSGYASEAASACLAYVFDELGRERIVAGVHPDNLASQRVLEKIGMRFLGLVYFEDSGADEPFYALTRTEWTSQSC